MRLDLLSKHDASFLLELISSTLSCNDEKELVTLVEDLKTLFPYDYAVCVYDKRNNGCRETRQIINPSYPQGWCELYIENGYDKIDPILRQSLITTGIQYWDDTYSRYEDAKDFAEAAKDFGLSQGYSFKTTNRKGDNASLFSFAGKTIKRNQRTELILNYITPHLHQAFGRIIDAGKETNRSLNVYLSSREKEVLRWARDGKNTWEISAILAISQDTVKFHVKNIMQKLQTVTRTQAVAVAIQSGLIGSE